MKYQLLKLCQRISIQLLTLTKSTLPVIGKGKGEIGIFHLILFRKEIHYEELIVQLHIMARELIVETVDQTTVLFIEN
jgi:hypothetical protein